MSDQKITIDTRLALQWQALTELRQAEQTDFINTSAIQLLDVLETQHYPKLLSSNMTSDYQSDLSRLESKVDLLLLLYTRNQYNQQFSDIPNFYVSLSADTLTIKTTASLEKNQLIEIDIFFNQNCPEPILFSGKVIATEFSDTLTINFCNMGQKTQTYLEKFIFRFHRNEIARSKKN